MTRAGFWRFDGERYWSPPEMIPSTWSGELPALTEDEQLEMALTYVANVYGNRP